MSLKECWETIKLPPTIVGKYVQVSQVGEHAIGGLEFGLVEAIDSLGITLRTVYGDGAGRLLYVPIRTVWVVEEIEQPGDDE